MSVYAGEKAMYFKQSITSMLEQTIKPDQFVIVCDGYLPSDLEDVIQSFCRSFPELFRLVRLDQNHGLGVALNHGLSACSNEWIVRMDSDDISKPNRCQLQLSFAMQNNLDLCSGQLEEFEEINGKMQITCKRSLPCTHREILFFAQKRNPMNHPCVVYRKSIVEKVGGYRQMPYFEDYDLWIRILLNGGRSGNLPQSILYMRAGKNMYKRRTGWKYCRYMYAFWKEAYNLGFCTRMRYVRNVVCRGVICILPNALVRYIYLNRLREKYDDSI